MKLKQSLGNGPNPRFSGDKGFGHLSLENQSDDKKCCLINFIFVYVSSTGKLDF
jgi:hypothetical protein